jgi:gamma-glutamyltranspeptidase/glutathione hydrolase
MPAMKAIYRRFGTRPWASLCEDAVYWAQDGHPVSSFEYGVNLSEQDFTTYFPEGRRFYMPNGYWPRVGERFASADLAATLRRVRDHGPDDMIDGEWAEKFVAKARDMGWAITLADMSANPPRWIEPMRLKHHEFEIISLAQPEMQGVFISMVLGILSHLDIRSMTPQSADHHFAMSHALRLALYFCGFLGDPIVAPYGADVLIDPAFHKSLARLIEGLKPRVDLSRHLALTGGPGNRGDEHGLAGLPSAGDVRPLQPPGSCELSIVDEQGNWVQMMNTLQSGGIPGMVVGGVAMIGSHATFAGISGHFDIKLVEGARLRTIVGNTLVLKQGQPIMGLGTPGNVFCTMPQVLTNLLDFGMEPYAAIDAPRHLHLGEDNCLIIEDRLDPKALSGLAALGVGVSVMPAYDWHMGSFQMCYRDGPSGELCATVDPRRCGEAGGLF